MTDDYIPSQIILDYYSDPVNYGVLTPYDLKIIGKNKDCADLVTIYVKFSKNIVKKISFKHSGCVISKAGASITTELVLNKSIPEIISLNQDLLFESMGGVLQTRIKCAFLGLNLLKKAFLDISKNKTKFPKTLSLEI